MTNNRKKRLKFLSLYNSFSQKERNEFQKYLKNNLSTSHRNYYRILSSLEINDKGIINIDGARSSVSRWNRLSELNLLAENFLLNKSIESDLTTKRSLMLKEYHRKKLLPTFRQKYNTLKKELSKVPVVNYDYNIISQLDMINLKYLEMKIRPGKGEKTFIEIYNFRLGIFLYELLDILVDTKSRRNEKGLVSDFIAEEIFSNMNFEMILPYLSAKSNISNKLYPLIRFLYSLYLCQSDISDTKSYLNAKKIFSEI